MGKGLALGRPEGGNWAETGWTIFWLRLVAHAGQGSIGIETALGPAGDGGLFQSIEAQLLDLAIDQLGEFRDFGLAFAGCRSNSPTLAVLWAIWVFRTVDIEASGLPIDGEFPDRHFVFGPVLEDLVDFRLQGKALLFPFSE